MKEKDRVQFIFTTVAAELQSHKKKEKKGNETVQMWKQTSGKFLENKAYNTKEVTLIKTSFTEYWPRQDVQIHHLHILQQNSFPTSVLNELVFVKYLVTDWTESELWAERKNEAWEAK